jgi:peptidoglycan/xylan/chitin deacetylase (PgdA/CDA1 family)
MNISGMNRIFPCPTRFVRAAAGLLPVLLAAATSGCLPKASEPIPILMYHNIAKDPGDDVWTISTGEFRHQIENLKANGYRTILPKDLAHLSRWKFWLPRKPVVITFDDGLLSTLTEAEPILHEAGFQAVSYLISGFIAESPAERKPYRYYTCLTWEEVRAMKARGTFVFGSHSDSHGRNPVALTQEVEECRNIFKRNIGEKTMDFCYPYGVAPDVLVQAVVRAGYRTAMACDDRMFVPGTDTNLFRIPRISIFGGIHEFAVSPVEPSETGGFCASAANRGVPLPVRGMLRDLKHNQVWPLPPTGRFGPEPQRWCWTNLPPDLDASSLQVEIWEQNGIFRYYP